MGVDHPARHDLKTALIDHPVSVTQEGWATLRRILAFLGTDLEIEKPQERNAWVDEWWRNGWPFRDDEEWLRNGWPFRDDEEWLRNEQTSADLLPLSLPAD